MNYLHYFFQHFDQLLAASSLFLYLVQGFLCFLIHSQFQVLYESANKSSVNKHILRVNMKMSAKCFYYICIYTVYTCIYMSKHSGLPCF